MAYPSAIMFQGRRPMSVRVLRRNHEALLKKFAVLYRAHRDLKEARQDDLRKQELQAKIIRDLRGRSNVQGI